MIERKQNIQPFLLRWAAARREAEVGPGGGIYGSVLPFLKAHSDMRLQKHPARYEKTMGVRGMVMGFGIWPSEGFKLKEFEKQQEQKGLSGLHLLC